MTLVERATLLTCTYTNITTFTSYTIIFVPIE